MYGPLASFAYLWTYLLGVRCPANVLKVLILARSLSTLVFPDCDAPNSSIVLIAIVIQGQNFYSTHVHKIIFETYFRENIIC